jgi:hypothetical protein
MRSFVAASEGGPMFFTMFQRLSRCFQRDENKRLRRETSRNRQTRPWRRFVPELTVLEERSLPSIAHGPLFGLMPHHSSAPVISLGHSGHGAGVRVQHAAVQADTRVVPLKITGGGNAPNGLPVIPGLTAPYNATGTATHLGRYTETGIFSLDSLDFSTLSGTFHASATFVAANGDELVGEFAPGTFSLTPPDANGKVVATFIATLTPVPGASTGRFANVTGGSLVMIATTEPFVLSVNAQGYTPSFTYTWEGQGTLEFAKGDN